MSLLSELKTLLDGLGVPSETGAFRGKSPDAYAVIMPLADVYEVFADDAPQTEVQEAQISLFSISNYQRLKDKIVKALLEAGITITDRRYVGYETDTKYHHYAVDAAKEYELEE
jgi:hypothetical protein